jgi:hypothetical protein
LRASSILWSAFLCHFATVDFAAQLTGEGIWGLAAHHAKNGILLAVDAPMFVFCPSSDHATFSLRCNRGYGLLFHLLPWTLIPCPRKTGAFIYRKATSSAWEIAEYGSKDSEEKILF